MRDGGGPFWCCKQKTAYEIRLSRVGSEIVYKRQRPIDKHLTDEERALQLKEIKADISYFKRSYERADLHVTITGLGPEASAAAIDARLGGI